MTINDVTFGHDDFVGFARIVGYGITDPLTVFARNEGEFENVSSAKAIRKRLVYIMESLNAKEGKWNPSEHHFYRITEAFSHYTEKYIDEKHAETCTKMVRHLIHHMRGYNPQVSDGKYELKGVVNLLVNYNLMDIDEHGNMIDHQ